MRAKNAPTVEQYVALIKSMVNPENAVRGEDMPYWTRVLEESGNMVNWLADIGVGFATMGIRYGTTPFLAPGPYQGGAGYAMEYMADHFVKNGGRIIYSTPVTDLIQDDNGRVTGLVAQGNDGTTWTVNAKAVLLASGGFGANREMFDEYYPQYAGAFINCAKGSTGDGIVLVRRLAARWSAWDARWARSCLPIRASMSWRSFIIRRRV